MCFKYSSENSIKQQKWNKKSFDENRNIYIKKTHTLRIRNWKVRKFIGTILIFSVWICYRQIELKIWWCSCWNLNSFHIVAYIRMAKNNNMLLSYAFFYIFHSLSFTHKTHRCLMSAKALFVWLFSYMAVGNLITLKHPEWKKKPSGHKCIMILDTETQNEWDEFHFLSFSNVSNETHWAKSN